MYRLVGLGRMMMMADYDDEHHIGVTAKASRVAKPGGKRISLAKNVLKIGPKLCNFEIFYYKFTTTSQKCQKLVSFYTIFQF